jgi:4-diphosphocytidyl-2-C-methyl-D-erythritol kinase
MLRIMGRRPDGYYDIESLVQKVSLYDRITLTEKKRPGITLTCSDSALPSGAENLAYRAAMLLLDASGTPNRGVSIGIEKNIPHGAGLGGGSSDAASVLMGLNSLLDLSVPPEKLLDLAVEIGSDVPLFLYPSPALIRGRGETVTAAPLWINAIFVVVFPGFEVSTRWAYSNFRLTKDRRKYTISPLYKVKKGELPSNRWRDLLVNELEAAVTMRHPEISRCKEDLARFGARASLMSGSGSSVFGLFEDRSAAEQAAAYLTAEWGYTAFVAVPLFS